MRFCHEFADAACSKTTKKRHFKLVQTNEEGCQRDDLIRCWFRCTLYQCFVGDMPPVTSCKFFHIIDQDFTIHDTYHTTYKTLYVVFQKNCAPSVWYLWRSCRFSHLGFYTVEIVRLQLGVRDLVRVNLTRGC